MFRILTKSSPWRRHGYKTRLRRERSSNHYVKSRTCRSDILAASSTAMGQANSSIPKYPDAAVRLHAMELIQKPPIASENSTESSSLMDKMGEAILNQWPEWITLQVLVMGVVLLAVVGSCCYGMTTSEEASSPTSSASLMSSSAFAIFDASGRSQRRRRRTRFGTGESYQARTRSLLPQVPSADDVMLGRSFIVDLDVPIIFIDE